MNNFFDQITQVNKASYQNCEIYYERIVGARRLSNYFWATTILLASSGFFITGLSSYLQYNIINFLNANEIIFFPQGLVMWCDFNLG